MTVGILNALIRFGLMLDSWNVSLELEDFENGTTQEHFRLDLVFLSRNFGGQLDCFLHASRRDNNYAIRICQNEIPRVNRKPTNPNGNVGVPVYFFCRAAGVELAAKYGIAKGSDFQRIATGPSMMVPTTPLD